MAERDLTALPDNPQLVANITHFARALRRAGVPIGTGRVIDAVRAVQAAGFTNRTDFFWVLHACFVARPDQRAIFDQVFRLFWRDPAYLEQMMSVMQPALNLAAETAADSAASRAAEALFDGVDRPTPDRSDDDDPLTEIDVDAASTVSDVERLRSLDFDQMSNADIAAAKRMLARLTLPVPPLTSRRHRAAHRGRIDPKRTLRASHRQGGEMAVPLRHRPRVRWPDLVVLCDISGSMTQYSRMILHFVHAVAQQKGDGWARVHAFTFGTRLTNITRHMRGRDVDAALASAGQEAQDWDGGTRIGDCLHAFNRDWSRRVLGRGAVVLLVTDGLDRGDPAALGREAQRLHLSSRRLIWLNPLLRWDGFAPRARGIAALLPHVDSFRAAHSVGSLETLGAALSSPTDSGEKNRLIRMLPQDR